MSLFALSIEAERLYLLMLLGRRRLQDGLLPPASSQLPAPMLISTDGYPVFRPWEVFRPTLSQVRHGWRAARLPAQPPLRQRSA